MIFIVDWQEIVGPDFMQTFIQIEKKNLHGDLDPWADHESSKISAEDKEKWKLKRRLMRFCGYGTNEKGEIDDHHQCGWTDKAGFKGEGIDFCYFSSGNNGKERTFISLSKFLDMKKSFELVRDEEEYYSTKPIIKKTMKQIEQPKQRADIDDVFVEERE